MSKKTLPASLHAHAHKYHWDHNHNNQAVTSPPHHPPNTKAIKSSSLHAQRRCSLAAGRRGGKVAVNERRASHTHPQHKWSPSIHDLLIDRSSHKVGDSRCTHVLRLTYIHSQVRFKIYGTRDRASDREGRTGSPPAPRPLAKVRPRSGLSYSSFYLTLGSPIVVVGSVCLVCSRPLWIYRGHLYITCWIYRECECGLRRGGYKFVDGYLR